jgi:hypothetical protein
MRWAYLHTRSMYVCMVCSLTNIRAVPWQALSRAVRAFGAMFSHTLHLDEHVNPGLQKLREYAQNFVSNITGQMKKLRGVVVETGEASLKDSRHQQGKPQIDAGAGETGEASLKDSRHQQGKPQINAGAGETGEASLKDSRNQQGKSQIGASGNNKSHLHHAHTHAHDAHANEDSKHDASLTASKNERENQKPHASASSQENFEYVDHGHGDDDNMTVTVAHKEASGEASLTRGASAETLKRHYSSDDDDDY